MYMPLDASPNGLRRRARAVGVVFVVVITVIGLLGSASAATVASTSAATGSQSAAAQVAPSQPNATATIQLDNTPDGLQLFNITVSASDPAMTNISDIQAGDISGNEFQVLASPAETNQNSVTFRGADLSGNIGRGSGTVVFATLNLTNSSVTADDLEVTVQQLTDESGNNISPGQVNVTVEARTQPQPWADGVPGVANRGPNNVDNDPQLEDVNGDGAANFSDAIDLAFADFTAINNGSPAEAAALDFDGDGDVDFDDALELAFDPALGS